MQYLLRFILANYVVFYHMLPSAFPYSGPMAVYGFFVISGYVITLSLQRVYLRRAGGVRDFLINRFWRLYPPVWTAMALGLVLAVFAPEVTAEINPALMLPEQTLLYVSNITILGLQSPFGWTSPTRFSPPAWTTAFELMFYLFMVLWGSRSRRTAALWLGTSVLMTTEIYAITLLHDQGVLTIDTARTVSSLTSKLYWNVFGLSLPFSLGVFAYFWKAEIKARCIKFRIPATALLVILPLIPICPFPPLSLTTTALLAALTIALWDDKPFGRISEYLGGLSLFIFLLHWQIAVVITLAGLGLPGTVDQLLLCLLTSFAAAALLHAVVERPLWAVRARIRQQRTFKELSPEAAGRTPHQNPDIQAG